MLRITSGFMVDALSLAAFSHNEETKSLLGKLLEMYQIERKSDPDSLDKDMEVFWNIIGDIVNADARLDKKSEIRRVCLKVKNSPIGKSDPSLVDTIEALLMDPDGLDVKRIEILKQRIKQWISMCHINKDLKKIMFNCNKYNPDDMTGGNEELFETVLDGMRKIVDTAENIGSGSQTIDVVSMSDPSSIMKSMIAYRNRHDKWSYPTHLKGLNRMLGHAGGFQRGKFYMWMARSHNGKSQLLMDFARALCIYSVTESQHGKRPAVLFISLENEVPENTVNMIRRAYINAFKEDIPKGMTDEQLIQCVASYYGKNGTSLIMMRKDDQFGYNDLLETVEQLEQKGVEVFAIIIDYLGLMRLEDGGDDNQAKKLQKLGHKLHDLAARTDRIVITAAQLSGEADIIASSGQTNIVKRYSAAHLSDCRSLKKEVDFLGAIEIEANQDGIPFLTFAWNKMRDEPPPDKENQYCAYRFEGNVLGILDDYNTDTDRSVSDIFSNMNSGNSSSTINPFADLGAATVETKPQVAGYGTSPAPLLTGEKPKDLKKDISEVLPDPVNTPEESKNDNTPKVEDGVVMIA